MRKELSAAPAQVWLSSSGRLAKQAARPPALRQTPTPTPEPTPAPTPELEGGIGPGSHHLWTPSASPYPDWRKGTYEYSRSPSVAGGKDTGLKKKKYKSKPYDRPEDPSLDKKLECFSCGRTDLSRDAFSEASLKKWRESKRPPFFPLSIRNAINLSENGITGQGGVEAKQLKCKDCNNLGHAARDLYCNNCHSYKHEKEFSIRQCKACIAPENAKRAKTKEAEEDEDPYADEASEEELEQKACVIDARQMLLEPENWDDDE
ncbi:hypothetical protein MNV49_003908 [Pseudohyphozyma bogoriensis]|nr:hypothetical protein MNV49_003908 [Pseudohyphozyma bogoriensis]